MSTPDLPRRESTFRDVLVELQEVRGNRPLWPVILGTALDVMFRHQCQSPESYRGEVFLDRDDHTLADGEREERLVARLFQRALSREGCVWLKGEPIWLLGFQWPTQGGQREKKRQADLVGLTTQGGLAVFEAKVARGGDSPLYAICEGLDYLACLLRPANFEKIIAGFERWRVKAGKVIPDGFAGTRPSRMAQPAIIILAPDDYFTGRHVRSVRSRDWPLISDCCPAFIPSVDLHFATTDFSSPTLGEPSRPQRR